MTCKHVAYTGPRGVRQCVKCKEPMPTELEAAHSETMGHLDTVRGRLPAKYLGLNLGEAVVRYVADLEARLGINQ